MIAESVTSTRTQRLRAALEAAKIGPVLPVYTLDAAGRCTCGGRPGCKPGKHPIGDLAPQGVYSATTNRSRIHGWFNRPGPPPNFAIRTGEGLVAVDIDPRHGGSWEAARAALGGELPDTYTVRTGGGGWHLYYRIPPGVEVRGRTVSPGVEIKAAGNYVVAAGSATQAPYTVEVSRTLAAAPPGLLEAGRGPRQASPSKLGGREPVLVDASGRIPYGQRNAGLTQLVGRAHDGTRDLDQLTAYALEANAALCDPPIGEHPTDLDPDEVPKIARSVYSRPPCKPGPEPPDAATLEYLDRLEGAVLSTPWPGMGAKGERDALLELVRTGRRTGRKIPGGARVAESYRELAEGAAMSRRTLMDYRRRGERKPGVISRLRRKGWIVPDRAGRGEGEAGAFVLRIPPEVEAAQSFTTTSTGGGAIERGRKQVVKPCAPTTAPPLRWNGLEVRRDGDWLERVVIHRPGKGCGGVVLALESAGGVMEDTALAAALGVRVRDLRRRYLPPLETTEVVECSGRTVRLSAEWRAALDAERERGGEIAAGERHRERHARERAAFRLYRTKYRTWCRERRQRPTWRGFREWMRRPEPVPEKPPDGEIGELEPVQGAELPLAELYRRLHVGEPVQTPHGPGRLWQVFSDRVGVVLEYAPNRVLFLDPAALVLEGVA